MKHFMFSIAGNKIDEYESEVSGTGPEYIHYEKSFGVEEVYYKLTDGKVSDVICEAFTLSSATQVVNDFLSDLS